MADTTSKTKTQGPDVEVNVDALETSRESVQARIRFLVRTRKSLKKERRALEDTFNKQVNDIETRRREHFNELNALRQTLNSLESVLDNGDGNDDWDEEEYGRPGRY